MNKIILIIFLILAMSCNSQKSTLIPENFSEVTIPERFSKDWYNLNYSHADFSVYNINEKLQIKNIEPKNGSTLKIKNGILIGENGGEWGGKLLFQSNIEKSIPLKIKDGNIVKIFTFKNRMFFIEGIAHLNISEGALYELFENNNNFTFKKLIDFDDAPEAIATYKDKIYIASHENFYEIENFKKKVVFTKQFWTSLYPNTIAIFNEQNIFIGMRSGIVKINLENKTVNFYQKK